MVKILLLNKTDPIVEGIKGLTTEGTRPHFTSLPKIPKPSNYLRDSLGRFYRVMDHIFQNEQETEITAFLVDSTDALWEENIKEGNYISLPF